MTLSYLESGHANPSPRKTRVTLAPRETRVFDPLGPPILTSVDSIGALRIESNADVVASARIYGYLPAEGPQSAVSMALTGIPTRLGVGNGQSAILHGDGSRDAQYKLLRGRDRGRGVVGRRRRSKICTARRSARSASFSIASSTSPPTRGRCFPR